MTYLIYGLLIFINIFYGLKAFFYPFNKIKRKASAFIMIFTIIGCYLLMAGYRNNSGLTNDLSNNMYEYMNVGRGGISTYEIGYYIFMRIGNSLGLDFFAWRSCIIFLCILVIIISTWKSCQNPHFVIGEFCAYLIIIHSLQFRVFIALSIYTIAINIFLFSNTKMRSLLYVILTILAATVHSMFLVYLIIPLSEHILNYKYLKLIVVTVIMFCIVIFINGNTIPGISILLNLTKQSSASIYLSQRTRIGFIYPMFLHIITTLLLSYGTKKCSYYGEEVNQVILDINMILMLFFPLYMLQIHFYRIERSFLLTTYIANGNSFISNKNNCGLYFLLCILVLCAWIYIDLFVTSPAEAVLIPFFTENHYFNLR